VVMASRGLVASAGVEAEVGGLRRRRCWRAPRPAAKLLEGVDEAGEEAAGLVDAGGRARVREQVGRGDQGEWR
jgi:hypothetical protein